MARYGRRLVLVHEDRPDGVVGSFDAEAARQGVRRELHSTGQAEGAEAEHKLHQDLVEARPDFVLLAHRYLPRSKGTLDVALRAMLAEVPCYLIDGPDAEPRRLEEITPPASHSRKRPCPDYAAS